MAFSSYFGDSCRVLTRVACVAMLALGGLRAGAEELYFTLLHTNDEHSALLPAPLVDYHPDKPNPAMGGFARLSGLVNEIRAEKSASGEPVVLASGGDILGGAPFFWLIPEGEAPEISVMQRIGYDVVTIGNHEFDYGSEMLGHYYQAAGYPEAHARTAVVSSNLVVPEGHPLAPAEILDTHIVTLDNGLKLGFFGLLGHYAARLATMMDPITITDPATAAQRAADELRAQGVDLVIGVTHSGLYEDEPVFRKVSGVDLVVTSHCHTALYEPMRVGDALLVQAGAYMKYLGMIELAYNRDTGALRVRNEENARPFLIPLDDSIDEDPVIAAYIEEYTGKLNNLVRRMTDGAIEDVRAPMLYSDYVLAADPPHRESIWGNFVADAMRRAVEETVGERADLAIQANGVIRGSVRPGVAGHAQNQITFYDLATTVGLGTGGDGVAGFPLASIYLTGSEIYRMFEGTMFLSEMISNIFYLQVSGARVTYDPNRKTLFSIPFTRLAVPTMRAIREIELYTGADPQHSDPDAYVSISRRDDTLYHVVCDAYILSFFPRVSEFIPIFSITPKDRHGNPISLEDAVIWDGGRELKFWQAVVKHAITQPDREADLPRVAAYYAKTGDRLVQEAGYPLAVWTIPAVLVFAVVVVRGRRRLPWIGRRWANRP